MGHTGSPALGNLGFFAGRNIGRAGILWPECDYLDRLTELWRDPLGFFRLLNGLMQSLSLLTTTPDPQDPQLLKIVDVARKI